MAAMFAAVASASLLANAATDAWNTTTTPSSWASTGNWSLGNLPAVTDTADFSQLDITAATTVTLDGNQVINQVIFGDTVTNTAFGWVISAGTPTTSALTFGGVNPTIVTEALGGASIANITAQINATNLTFVGPGVFNIGYLASVINGIIITNGGTVEFGSGANTGWGTLTFTGNGLFSSGLSSTYSIGINAITNMPGVVATINVGGRSQIGATNAPSDIGGNLTIKIGPQVSSPSRDYMGGTWENTFGTPSILNFVGTATNAYVSPSFTGSGGNTAFNSQLTNATFTFSSSSAGVNKIYMNPANNSTGNNFLMGALSGTADGILTSSGSGPGTTYVVGYLNTNTTFNGSFVGDASLIKVGTGILALGGTNSIGASTANQVMVVAGELDGVTGGSFVAPVMTVSNGAAMGVQVGSTGGVWTGTNLVLRAGSGLTFRYGGVAPSTTIAPLQVLGNLTATNTVTLNVLGGSGWTAGTAYPLAKYTGTYVGNGFSAFTLGTLPLRVTGTLSNDTVNSQIDLIVTAITEPLKWAATNGTWDIATTANWKDAAGTTTTYQEQSSLGDQVVLEDNLSGASPAITLNTTVSPVSVLITNNSKAYSIAGTGGIAGAGAVTKQGANTLTLATANTFTGGLNLNAGTVIFSAQNNLGAGAINFGGGALQYNTGNVADISGQPITFGAGGATINDGGNTVIFAKPVGNSGTGSFTKSGTGTLTLNGTNKYSGYTAVTAGTLALGSATTYISNSTAIIVSSGATLDATASGLVLNNQYLGGSGTVAGAVTVTNSSTLSPGTNNAYGTLTFSGNLTLGGGTNFLDVSATNKDLIAIGGSLNLAGAINSGSVFINVHGSLTNGVYRLITYAGSLNGTFSTLGLAGFSAAGKVGSLTSTLNANEIDLVVASAGSANLVWSGSGGSSWDVESTQNWLLAGNPAFYDDGDTVTFDDSSSNPSVSLAATFTPAKVVINATNNAYTFSGSGQISGAAGITLNGPAVTMIETVNNNTGPTVLNNGAVLQVGFGGPGDLGGGNITNNGGTLIFDQAAAAAHVVSGQISGTGSLVAEGSDPIVLAGNNTYSGLTTISNSYSVLQVGNGGSTGNLGNSPGVVDNGVLALSVGGGLALTNGVSGTGEVIVNGSGTVSLTGANTWLGNTYISNGIVKLTGSEVIPDANSVAGSTGWLILDGGSNPAGVLDLNGNNETVNSLSGLGGTYTGVITNSGTTGTNVFTVLQNLATTYNGTMVDNASGAKTMLVVRGTSSLRLNGNNTYTGGTILGDSATLIYGPGAIIGNGGGITLSNGTTFSMVSNGGTGAFPGNNLNLALGASATFNSSSAGNTTGTLITGDPTSTLNLTGTGSFSGSNVKEFEAMLGTVNVASGASWRFSGTTAATYNGGDYTTFNVNGGIYPKNGGLIIMDKLTGSGTLGASSTANNTVYDIGVNNGSSTFDGTISDGGTLLVGLVKSGTGTLTLDGTLTYSGTTVVSNGVLALAGSAVPYTSPSITLVASTSVLDVTGVGGTLNLGSSVGQTLAGSGTLNGSLNVGSGYGSYLSPGSTGVAGTLTIAGSANLGSGTTNLFDFNTVTNIGGGTNDLLQVNGDLSLSGTVYVQPNFPQGGVDFGVPYTIIKYTGALTGDTNNLALAPTLYGHLGAVFNTSTPGAVTVTFTPGSNLVWSAASTNTWQVATVTNWFDGVTSNSFLQLDSVTFNDTASNTTVMLVGTNTPASITVNSSSNYVFGGAGLISGATGLSKSGTGMLTISNTGVSTYSGAVNISGGILRAGNANALGTTVGVTITNTGALDVGGLSFSAKSVTVSGAGTAGAILNSGAAQQTALQFVTLAGNTTFGGPNRWDIRTNVVGTPYLAGNGYTLTKVSTNDIYLVGLGNTALGNVQVQSGRLGVQDSTLLGSTGTVTLAPGSALDLWLTTVTNTKAISLTNATLSSSSGTNVLGGSIALNGTGTLTATVPFQLNGALTGAGGIIKNGASTLTLTAAGTYAGSTVISNGVLALVGAGSIASSPTVDVTTGAQLDLSALASPTLALVSGQTLQGAGSVKGSVSTAGSAILAPGEAAAGTLTVSNNVTLGGNAVFVVNSTGVSSKLVAGGSIGLGGTLTINNGGPAFAVGNSFTLLSAGTITGSFASISPATPGAGLAWNTTGLATGVLSVVSGVASNPTNISYTLTGTTLSLTWPTDHLGWILQSQTNAATVGLIVNSNAWTDVAGSASSTSATITVDSTKPTVFFRLRQP